MFRGAAVPYIVQRGGGVGAFLGPLFRAGGRAVLRTAVPLAKGAAKSIARKLLRKGATALGGVVAKRVTGRRRRAPKRRGPSLLAQVVQGATENWKENLFRAPPSKRRRQATRRTVGKRRAATVAAPARRTVGVNQGGVRKMRKRQRMVMARQRVIQTGGRYEKGSAQAKRFMRKLRAMRHKTRSQRKRDIFG